MKNTLLIFVLILVLFALGGCVRLAGGAGYWHSDSEGEIKSKQVGFDTHNLVSGERMQGDIQ